MMKVLWFTQSSLLKSDSCCYLSFGAVLRISDGVVAISYMTKSRSIEEFKNVILVMPTRQPQVGVDKYRYKISPGEKFSPRTGLNDLAAGHSKLIRLTRMPGVTVVSMVYIDE